MPISSGQGLLIWWVKSLLLFPTGNCVAGAVLGLASFRVSLVFFQALILCPIVILSFPRLFTSFFLQNKVCFFFVILALFQQVTRRQLLVCLPPFQYLLSYHKARNKHEQEIRVKRNALPSVARENIGVISKARLSKDMWGFS